LLTDLNMCFNLFFTPAKVNYKYFSKKQYI
jgi:hypothetical protein